MFYLFASTQYNKIFTRPKLLINWNHVLPMISLWMNWQMSQVKNRWSFSDSTTAGKKNKDQVFFRGSCVLDQSNSCSANAETLFQVFSKKQNELGLEVTKVGGMASNGASVMLRFRTGLTNRHPPGYRKRMWRSNRSVLPIATKFGQWFDIIISQ